MFFFFFHVPLLCHICAEPQWWVPRGLIKVQNAHRTSCGFHQPGICGSNWLFFFFFFCCARWQQSKYLWPKLWWARATETVLVVCCVIIKPSENLPHTVNTQRYNSGTQLGMMDLRWILTKLHQRQVSRDCCRENITWVSSAVTD